MGILTRTFIALIALLLAGCAGAAERDARLAVSHGDRHLIGYMGFGLVVPGTPPGFNPSAYQPGIKVMPDFTDTNPPPKSQSEYAERYNRVILGNGR